MQRVVLLFMAQNTYSIKQYRSDKKGRVRFIRFNIHHQREGFGLEQDLDLRCDKQGRWTTTMNMCGMNGQREARLSIKKMAVWLQSMATAMEDLQDKLETGLLNPIQQPVGNYGEMQTEPYRYTKEGLIERLKECIDPLEPLITNSQ
jgi:hypothetical protein